MRSLTCLHLRTSSASFYISLPVRCNLGAVSAAEVVTQAANAPVARHIAGH